MQRNCVNHTSHAASGRGAHGGNLSKKVHELSSTTLVFPTGSANAVTLSDLSKHLVSQYLKYTAHVVGCSVGACGLFSSVGLRFLSAFIARELRLVQTWGRGGGLCVCVCVCVSPALPLSFSPTPPTLSWDSSPFIDEKGNRRKIHQ